MEDTFISHQGNEITTAQRIALHDSLNLNLTDGHPRRALLPNEQEAIACLPELFALAADLSIPEVEQGLLAEYAKFSDQTIPPEASFIFPSASNALLCTAMLLRQSIQTKNGENLNVGCITPVFDNIPGIMKGFGMDIEAVVEPSFTDETALEAVVADKDVLLLVSPNNPTGFTLSSEQLTVVAKVCKSAGTVLVIDSCFRMYKPKAQFDTAKVLDEAEVSYAVINDTGKLWALHENKAGILTVSPDLCPQAKAAHDLMQLSASSTTMLMLTDLMRRGGDMAAIKDLISQNRKVLKEALAANDNAALIYPEHETGLPVELLEFSSDVHHLDGSRASSLGSSLLRLVTGIHTMPITDFMLDFKGGEDIDPVQARVTLARGTKQFADAAQRLGSVTSGQLMQVLYDRYL